MKTKKEIAEIAEREYPNRYKEDISYDYNEEAREGFIKGYQAAQEEMKQCATCKSLSDTWDNEKDEQFNNL